MCFKKIFSHRAVNENIERTGEKKISLLYLVPVDGEEKMVDADSTRLPRWSVGDIPRLFIPLIYQFSFSSA